MIAPAPRPRIPFRLLIIRPLMILLLLPGVRPLAAQDRVFFVEPFDFHYPDETSHSEIGNAVRIKVSRGERESGTFVFMPSSGRFDIRLEARDLEGPSGSVLPACLISLGVVTFMSREGNREYLDDVWIGGLRAGAGKGGDSRGFNQDAKDRLPVLPVAIVPDEVEFDAEKGQAVGHITLTWRTDARTRAAAGEGKQFWVTVRVPDDFSPPRLRSLYRGSLRLTADGQALDVPLEVEVLDFVLDDPWEHGRHLGVMRSFGDTAPEFQEAVIDDLLAHGLNMVREPLTVPEDYVALKDRGFDMAMNVDWNLTSGDFEQVREAGFEPYVYGGDEPGNHATYGEHIAITEQVHARGGLCGTAGSFQALTDIDPVAAQDWWAVGLGVIKWYSASRWAENKPMRDHLDRLRRDPSAKIADLEAHYASVLNSHYPLGARILLGFWLYHSRLDGAASWGYCVRGRVTNPYTETSAFATAFPVLFLNPDGSLHSRAVLPSHTWEAYREGIDDLRYALTAERLLGLYGSPEQEERFTELLSDFVLLEDDGNRYDYRNPSREVREARDGLIDLICEILGENGYAPGGGKAGRRRRCTAGKPRATSS
jgi:hypothetical protein